MRTIIPWLWKVLLLSLFFWVQLSGVSVAGKQAEAYYHFLRGVRAYQEGHLSEARRELSRVLREDPQALYPRKLLAEIYGRLGQYEKAEAVIRQALKLAPEDQELLLLLARVYLSEKRFLRAIATLEKVVEKNPQNQEALGLLLNAYLSQQDLEGAIRSLERILKYHPRSAPLWLFKARLLARAGHPQEARQAYLKAVDLSPGDLRIIMEAGEFFRKSGSFEEAIKLYQKALRQDPQNVHLQQALLQLYVESGRWQEAENFLKKELKKEPENERVLFLLGMVLEKAGKTSEALATYEKIPPQSDLYPDAVEHIFNLKRKLSGPEEALAYLREVLASSPEDPKLYFLAATAAEEMDYCQEGLSFVDQGLTRFPHNQDLILTKGLLLSCVGRLREALSVVKPLLSEAPEDPVVLNFVGYTYAELGENLEEAEKLIRKALKKEPEAGYIVDSLAWVLYKRGKTREALKEIERAVKLSQGDPIILEHQGDILQSLGRREEACRVYREALSRVKHRRDRERIQKKVKKCPSPQGSS
ncbi:MAG: hypothetical protein DSZ24_01640 [Thermodesulfatator sp.]|nr:MAG: hypothetical protein DSZ24_01640 [Thermodesulfatator sp.]